MSDIADRAGAREEELRADALLEQTRRAGWNSDGVSNVLCEDCQDEIPEARRQALPGVRTCIDCQELRELTQ